VTVAVVGAGLAGLYAGTTLMQAGVDVVVLEARERVGGRTFSQTLANGVTIERGGEYVDVDHHDVRRVCAELGLNLIPHGIAFQRRQLNGKTPTAADVVETMGDAAALTRARIASSGQDLSVHEAFLELLGPAQAAHPVARRLIISMGAPADQMSAGFYLGSESPPPWEHGARVEGGNQRISLELARMLGSRVRLSTPVLGVSQDGGRARLRLASGVEEEYDAVVLAVPLPLLCELDWGRGIPAEWAPGLDQLGFGLAAKFSAQLHDSARPAGVQADGENWWSWNSVDAEDEACVKAVTAFAGGAECVESLQLSDGGTGWFDRVQALRPDLRLVPGTAVVTDWLAERWTQGAYSYAKVGWSLDRALGIQARAGNLVLAGEYTADVSSSSMNAALMSGLRAARTLLP
jgi:monoamine oxidase